MSKRIGDPAVDHATISSQGQEAEPAAKRPKRAEAAATPPPAAAAAAAKSGRPTRSTATATRGASTQAEGLDAGHAPAAATMATPKAKGTAGASSS